MNGWIKCCAAFHLCQKIMKMKQNFGSQKMCSSRFFVVVVVAILSDVFWFVVVAVVYVIYEYII